MLDILILTPWFPNRPDGWPARFISDSALALAEEGHRIRIGVVRGFAPAMARGLVPREHRGQIEADEFDGIGQIRERRYFALPRGLMRGVTNRSMDSLIRDMLDEFLRERRPDLLLVHTEALVPGAMPIVQREKLPILTVLHGQNTNTAYLTAGGQAERFRRALSAVDRLLIVGEPMRPYAEQLSDRNDHIETVWNGVYPPDGKREAPVPDNRPLELITVTNLQEGKGVDLLLKALEHLHNQELDDWSLTIIGDGPLRTSLLAQAEMAGLSDRVKFLGAKSNAEVFRELENADVFVLPSYREAFGVAYLEAMATGLLTIGVRGEGPSQFIEDGVTGFLVAPKSVDSLVVGLRPVLQGPRGNWRRVAAAGAKYVRQHCTWQAHARSLAAVMERTILERREK